MRCPETAAAASTAAVNATGTFTSGVIWFGPGGGSDVPRKTAVFKIVADDMSIQGSAAIKVMIEFQTKGEIPGSTGTWYRLVFSLRDIEAVYVTGSGAALTLGSKRLPAVYKKICRATCHPTRARQHLHVVWDVS